MEDSYSKQSKRQCLSISLRKLGIDESTKYGFENAKNYYSLFMQLTTFTPTKQSHLGKKFEEYKKLNNNTSESFVKKIFSGLGVDNVYLYQVFNTEKNKKSLLPTVLSDTGSMICLRCCNGVKNSLYMSIRNALAHGNIIYKDKYYILYSVSDDNNEYDSPITLLLKIKSLKHLESLVKVLDLYK